MRSVVSCVAVRANYSRYKLDQGPRLPAPTDGDAKWNMLFPFGTRYRSDFPGGKVELNADFLGKMLANFKKLAERYKGEGSDTFKLPVTYFHPDTEDSTVPVENKLANGWILDLELRDDGLFALEKFDDEARKLVAAEKVSYQSPEFAFDWKDSFTGQNQGPTLFGASLLNTPFLKDMPRVAASEGNAMADAPKSFKEKACAMYGLANEASDDSVMAEMQKHKASHDKLQKMEADAAAAKDKGGASGDGDGDADDKAKAAAERQERVALSEAKAQLETKLSESNKRIAALEKEAHDSKVKALTDKLISEAKIEAKSVADVAEMASKMGLEWTAKHFGSRLPIVTLREVGVSGEQEGAGDEVTKAQVKFNEKVAELTKDGKVKMGDAIKRVQRENPELSKVLFSAKANSRQPQATE